MSSLFGFGKEKKEEDEKLAKKQAEIEQEKLKTRKAILSTPAEILDREVIVEYMHCWKVPEIAKSGGILRPATTHRRIYNAVILYHECICSVVNIHKSERIKLMWKCNGNAIVIEAPIIPGSNDEKKLLSIFNRVEDIPFFKQIRFETYQLFEYIEIMEEIKVERASEDSIETTKDTISPLIEFEEND